MAWKLGAAGIYSDDFYDGSPLQSHWSVKTETGSSHDFEGAGTSDAFVVLTQDNTSHKLDPDIEHYYIYQSVSSDTDFEIEVSWDVLDETYGVEGGILCEDSTGANMVGLGKYRKFSPAYRTIFSFKVDDDSFDYAWGDDVNVGTSNLSMPLTMRIKRTVNGGTPPDDLWEFWYQEDGESEVKLSTTPVFDFTVDKVGIYIANHDTVPAGEHKADWFFENSAVISPEDTQEGLLNGARRVFVVS
jgi:hypothetical protein